MGVGGFLLRKSTTVAATMIAMTTPATIATVVKGIPVVDDEVVDGAELDEDAELELDEDEDMEVMIVVEYT